MTSSSQTSNSEMSLTPESIREEANSIINNLLPSNSRDRYLKTYKHFMEWREEKNVKSFSENVFLAYFNELAKKYQPSSLWSTYSMLKSTVISKNNINLKNYDKLVAFLKRQSDGYKCKKSKVFTSQEIETFLKQAPDDVYLATKVKLILILFSSFNFTDLTKILIKCIFRWC